MGCLETTLSSCAQRKTMLLLQKSAESLMSANHSRSALYLFWTTKSNPFFPLHSVEWIFKYEHVAIGLANVVAPGYKTIMRRLDVSDSVELNALEVAHEAKESTAHFSWVTLGVIPHHLLVMLEPLLLLQVVTMRVWFSVFVDWRHDCSTAPTVFIVNSWWFWGGHCCDMGLVGAVLPTVKSSQFFLLYRTIWDVSRQRKLEAKKQV